MKVGLGISIESLGSKLPISAFQGTLAGERRNRLIGNEIRSARVSVSKAIVLGHARFELLSHFWSIWEDEAAFEFQRVRFVFSIDSQKQELLARSQRSFDLIRRISAI